jgi:hypothetical protein
MITSSQNLLLFVWLCSRSYVHCGVAGRWGEQQPGFHLNTADVRSSEITSAALVWISPCLSALSGTCHVSQRLFVRSLTLTHQILNSHEG